MANVLFLQRRPTGSQVSIERLFDGIRRCLSRAVSCSVHVCPFPSRGLLPRICNALSARRAARGRLCHITGDVHYLALALPPEKTILTIHDCAVLHRLTGWRREVVRKLWFEWPVRRSAVVTTISEATRDDLARWLPARLHSRIRVVPNCVRAEFTAAPKEFNVARPVFLQVGTGWNKNLERVIDALRGLPCHLEIVGPLSSAQLAALELAAIDFTSLGRIDDAGLVEAYRRCDVVIFVSLFEGFGLPVVEAQATGRPVITSQRGPLPEIAGKAALFVDPEKVDSIRAAIEALCSDADLRRQLVDAGFENVRRFLPETIAARYEAIYHELAP